MAVETEKSGGKFRVVLRALDGELVTRDSSCWDFSRDPSVERRLSDQISKDSAPATQPAPPAGP